MFDVKRALVVFVVAATLVLGGPVADSYGAPSDGDQSGVNFNESWGCGNGISGPRPPLADSSGYMTVNQRVFGPWADMFGRNYYQIREATNPWVVPMSGGEVVYVHDRARPAYDAVSSNLADEFAAGNFYSSDAAGAWTWRTVGGKRNMSYHAFGTALDINSYNNPYNEDDVLITDMPVWYRDAWRSEGFCWGGDWVSVKDAMHYSWMGPVASNYPTRPVPFPPLNAPANMTRTARSAVFDSRMVIPSDGALMFGDLSGDGAPDVISLYPGETTYRLMVAGADSDFRHIGLHRDTGVPVSPGSRVFLADHELTSYPEIWVGDVSSSTLSLTVYGLDGEIIRTYATNIAVDETAEVATGHFDDDWELDLVVVQPGVTTQVAVWSGSSDFTSQMMSAEALIGDTNGSGWSFAVGDRNIDGIADVYAFEHGTETQVHVFDGAAGLTRSTFGGFASRAGDKIAIGDYDGDGYDDVAVIGTSSVEVKLGGLRGASEDFSRWFKRDDAEPWDALGPFDLGPFLTAEDLVLQQYRDFLGREGEEAGVEIWTSTLIAGQITPEQTIDEFMGSAEFGLRIAPVVRLYFTTFLRLPDYEGLLTWVNAANAGWSLERIADEFTTSEEFSLTYGELSDEEFVELLYNNVLERGSDPAGRSDWVARLESGQSRGAILVGFSESPEYRSKSEHEVIVTMAYLGMLRRAPEDGGFEYWVKRMDDGLSRYELMAGFFRSDEYASRIR